MDVQAIKALYRNDLLEKVSLLADSQYAQTE
jgi:hypothetical protein